MSNKAEARTSGATQNNEFSCEGPGMPLRSLDCATINLATDPVPNGLTPHTA